MYLMFLLLGMAIIFIPQMMVKSTYKKFAKVANSKGITGAEVARMILQNANITDVSVEPIGGELTDHYDPRNKVIRLSQDNYSDCSIAAIGVAAHEAGHVIQDYYGYIPMKVRSAIVPAANLGQTLGPILIMVGIGLRVATSMSNLGELIAILGIFFYLGIILFHLVTLPVEFNASNRAIGILVSSGYIDGREKSQVQKVLGAAAMTYVATAIYALMELIYWILRLYSSRR